MSLTRTRARTEPSTLSSEDGSQSGGGEEIEDEVKWVDRGEHPLLNELVLHLLFKYVKPADLKGSRLVCNLWNKASLPAARSSFEVIVLGKDLPGIWNLNADSHRIHDFVELFHSNPLCIPFTKFKLGSFDPTVGDGKKFFDLVGKNVKKVDLLGTGVHFIEDIGKLLRLTPKLEYFKMPREIISNHGGRVKLFSTGGIPSLKFLTTLDMGGNIAKIRKFVCPTFFEEFFSAAENISAVLTYETSVLDHVGLEVIEILGKMGRESQIEILSLPVFDTELMTALKEMPGVKLKQLRVKYGHPMPMELVELMKDNLISLRLRVPSNPSIPSQFPRMPKLELLELEIFTDPTGSQVPDFNDCFPALKFFKLNFTPTILEHLIKLEGVFTGSECCQMMETLCLGKSVVSLQTFDRVLNIFPNLKELQVTIEFEEVGILQRIFAHMTKLEILNIYAPLSVVHMKPLITGILSEDMKKISPTKLDELKCMTMEVRRHAITELIQEHRTLPSIENLTNLRHLSMNMGIPRGCHHCHHEEHDLSDFMGYLGFYSMRSLRHLNISDCTFSEACCQILVADTELHSWNIQCPSETHIIPPRWNSYNDNDGREWSFPSSKFSK